MLFSSFFLCFLYFQKGFKDKNHSITFYINPLALELDI